MSPLEVKKHQVELMQVQAGKAMLELKIEERLDEIERLKANILISEAKEQEIKEKLNTRKEG